MGQAYWLPYEYVNLLTKPGLDTTAGTVKLNQYMCQTRSNGGNDSAKSLYGNLRSKKNAAGESLNGFVGGTNIDQALKGQGQDTTFVKVWNFMLRNKELLKSCKVEACGRRVRGELDQKVVNAKGTVYDLYFDGRSDAAALQKMVEDRFFGIDCIGFVGTYLTWIGEWDRHKGGNPQQWAKWYCTKRVNKASDIQPLDFLIWDGHIAIVDWVWEYLEDRSVRVDICQSSSGGPQCNEYVILKETNTFVDKSRQFRILGGTPAPPVTGHLKIMRRKNFYYGQPITP